MLAVSIVAAAFGGYAAFTATRRRANRYRQLARFHARRATMFEDSEKSKDRAARDCEAYGGARMLRIAGEYREEIKICVKYAAFHAQLRRKYEHAAAQPWLPIESDPPEPLP
jgi:hypothetical protein